MGPSQSASSLVALLAIVALVLVNLDELYAQETSNSLVYSPDEQPYGIPYDEWTTKWWTWFISIPTDKNPINDHSGEMCTEYQSGSVWFLLGSGGGKAERSCNVPAGKAILIPNIIIECSYAEDQSLQTVTDLESCAKEGIDITTDVWARIDGVDLPDDQIYRVKSEPFNFTFPENNVFAAPAGPTQGVSDGYWTFIKPLPQGNHTIHVGGVQVDYTVTTPTNFVEDSTYHLTVVSGAPAHAVNQTVTIDGEMVSIPINTTSTISDFTLDANANRVRFSVAENNSQGETVIPISMILNGPYVVTIDGIAATDFETVNESDGKTLLRLGYDESAHEIAIVGTSVVPEFPFNLAFVLLIGIGAVALLSRRGSLKFSNS